MFKKSSCGDWKFTLQGWGFDSFYFHRALSYKLHCSCRNCGARIKKTIITKDHNKKHHKRLAVFTPAGLHNCNKKYGCFLKVFFILNFSPKTIQIKRFLAWSQNVQVFWVDGVWLYSIILVLCLLVLHITLVWHATCFPILIWQMWNKYLELSFVLVTLAVRYLNRSLPNHSLCARQTGSSSQNYRTT